MDEMTCREENICVVSEPYTGTQNTDTNPHTKKSQRGKRRHTLGAIIGLSDSRDRRGREDMTAVFMVGGHWTVVAMVKVKVASS